MQRLWLVAVLCFLSAEPLLALHLAPSSFNWDWNGQTIQHSLKMLQLMDQGHPNRVLTDEQRIRMCKALIIPPAILAVILLINLYVTFKIVQLASLELSLPNKHSEWQCSLSTLVYEYRLKPTEEKKEEIEHLQAEIRELKADVHKREGALMWQVGVWGVTLLTAMVLTALGVAAAANALAQHPDFVATCARTLS